MKPDFLGSACFQDAASEELSHQLHQLLERTYRLQDQFQTQLFHQMNANIAVDSAVQAIAEMDRVFGEQRSRHSSRASVDAESSDLDSFVSATDVSFFFPFFKNYFWAAYFSLMRLCPFITGCHILFSLKQAPNYRKYSADF